MPHSSIDADANWVQTFSGKKFVINNPQPDQILIEDIAHAESRLCRYTGHVSGFYSIAQHSVNCWRVAPKAHKLEALMHDASEYVLGDVSSPLKALLPDYRAIETNVQSVIARKFGFPEKTTEAVHSVDLRMLVTEAAHLFPNDGRERWWVDFGVDEYPLAAVDLRYWEPNRAEDLFLDAFYKTV
jgi:hypothetical protein